MPPESHYFAPSARWLYPKQPPEPHKSHHHQQPNPLSHSDPVLRRQNPHCQPCRISAPTVSPTSKMANLILPFVDPDRVTDRHSIPEKNMK
jgi:hypothetical protein